MVRPQTSAPTWPGSMAATSSRSAASATARQTSWPMRPPAPTTPTFCMACRLPGDQGGLGELRILLGRRGPRRSSVAAGECASSCGDLQDVGPPDPVNVGAGPRRPRAPRRAAAWTRRGGYMRAPESSPERSISARRFPLAARELPLAHPVGGQQLELPPAHDAQHLGDMLGRRAHDHGRASRRPGTPTVPTTPSRPARAARAPSGRAGSTGRPPGRDSARPAPSAARQKARKTERVP